MKRNLLYSILLSTFLILGSVAAQEPNQDYYDFLNERNAGDSVDSSSGSSPEPQMNTLNPNERGTFGKMGDYLGSWFTSSNDEYGTDAYNLKYRNSDDKDVMNTMKTANICSAKNTDNGADFLNDQCKREALVDESKAQTSILAGHGDTIMKGIQGLNSSPTDQAKGMSLLNGIQALDIFSATSEYGHLRDENTNRAHYNRIQAHDNVNAANTNIMNKTSGAVAKEHSQAFFKLADNVQSKADTYGTKSLTGKLGGLMTLGMAYQNWDAAEKMAKAEKERRNANRPLDPSQLQNGLPPLPTLTGPAKNDMPDLTEEEEEEVLANNYANSGNSGMGSEASQAHNGLSPFEKDQEQNQKKGTPQHPLSTKVPFLSSQGGGSDSGESGMDEALRRLLGEKQKEEQEARTIASLDEETKKEGSTLLSPKANIFKVITLAHHKHMEK